MGNCGFGIVPAPPDLRDLIMRNLAVVEGMDLDALRAGINWEFQSFAEYLAAVRRRAPYANLAVFVGHSAVRTAVMGEDASVRKQPTPDELAEMKRLVAEAMKQGASGSAPPIRSIIRAMAASRCRRRSARSASSMRWSARWASGAGGSSRSPPVRGTVAEMEEIAARHGRRIFMSTAFALYNEQYPRRAIEMFERLRRRPGARQRRPYPDHLPAFVLRFHA